MAFWSDVSRWVKIVLFLHRDRFEFRLSRGLLRYGLEGQNADMGLILLYLIYISCIPVDCPVNINSYP